MFIKATKLTALALLIALAGCAQTGGSDPEAGNAASQEANQDIPSSSPMSRITVGMSGDEARSILGRPDRIDSYQTGKSWIPYAGSWLNDKTRQSWYYHEMGYLVLSRNSYSGQYVVREFVYDPQIRAH